MNQPAHILISGRDSGLTALRGRVFQLAGYRVSTTLKPIEFTPDLSEIHLLIVCHTLTASERQRDLAVLGSSAPQAKAVCLTPHEDAVECGTPALDSFQGPREMLSMVSRLLSA